MQILFNFMFTENDVTERMVYVLPGSKFCVRSYLYTKI